MSWSDAASAFSIFLSLFAIHQANQSANRAETINQQTQHALNEIQSCTKKLKL